MTKKQEGEPKKDAKKVKAETSPKINTPKETKKESKKK